MQTATDWHVLSVAYAAGSSIHALTRVHCMRVLSIDNCVPQLCTLPARLTHLAASFYNTSSGGAVCGICISSQRLTSLSAVSWESTTLWWCLQATKNLTCCSSYIQLMAQFICGLSHKFCLQEAQLQVAQSISINTWLKANSKLVMLHPLTIWVFTCVDRAKGPLASDTYNHSCNRQWDV